MVKVFHDGVKTHGYLFIFLQVAASELGVLLAEDKWLLGLEGRLVVQTLGVTAPPPGLVQRQQDEEEEAREEGALQITNLRSHDAPDAVLKFREVWLKTQNNVVNRSSSVCDISLKRVRLAARQITCYRQLSETGVPLKMICF